MRSLLSALLLILAAGTATADEVPEPQPDPIGEKQIRMPIIPGPIGPPAPQPVTVLNEDQWYIIESDIPLIVLASRIGYVSITPEEGPLRIKGKFADGTGKVETRSYSGKYLFTIEAVAKGEVELLVIPAGATDESVVIRRTLSTMGPRPPPIPPDPEPEPDPDPDPPPVPVSSFRVIFVKESGETLNAQQTAIPGAKAIREYLDATATKEAGRPGWREYDPQENTANEQPVMKALWVAVKSSIQTVPCMIIEVNGHATVKPFPANVADALTVLKQAGGQ